MRTKLLLLIRRYCLAVIVIIYEKLIQTVVTSILFSQARINGNIDGSCIIGLQELVGVGIQHGLLPFYKQLYINDDEIHICIFFIKSSPIYLSSLSYLVQGRLVKKQKTRER